MVEPTQKSAFLDVKGASIYLGVAVATLNRWRCQGVGPRWRKFGGAIRYGVTDLDTWAEAQARTSTSDPGAAA